MRKEVVFAILGGILLGLIIGFGVYRINFAFKSNEAGESEPSPSPEAKGLTIAKPDYDDVVTQKNVTISGITSKSSYLVISSEESDYVVKSDEKGLFETEIDLEGGVNALSVLKIDENGKTVSQNLRLIYSNQMKKEVSKNEEISTESGVKEAALKKVEDVMLSPKAYIGTVTDISESTIQIKTDGDAIEQVSTKAEDLSVVKTFPASKEIKKEDIAIGDYIVAMGYKNGNGVLNAERILVSQPISFPEIKIYSGKTESLSKKEIILSEGPNISLSKTTKYSDKNIKTGDSVLIVAWDVKEVETARYVFLIPKSGM